MNETTLMTLGAAMIAGGTTAGVGLISLYYQNKSNLQKQLDDRFRLLFETYDRRIQDLQGTVRQLQVDLSAEIEKRKLAELGLDVADMRFDDTKEQLAQVSQQLEQAQIALGQEKALSRRQAERIETLEHRVRELESEVERLKHAGRAPGDGFHKNTQ